MAKNDTATKHDIEELAAITERAIRSEVASLRDEMATKEDLKRFATKEDLKQYATRDDLHDFKTDIFDYIDGAVERFEKSVTNMVTPIRRGVTNHEKRITRLEERVPT